MSKEGIFTTNGDDIDYAENLEEVIASHAGFDPESEDGSATPNRGKHVAGTNLGSIFAPFSSYQKETVDETDYFSPFTDLKSPEEIAVMSEQEQDIYNHYLSKYSLMNSFIVSDMNLEENYEDRKNGECYKIQKGYHDQEGFRTIGLRAPVYITGFGINSSGRMFDNNEVGPLDIVYNKKRGYWEHRQKFPVVGRIIEKEKVKDSNGNDTEDDTKFTYKVEVVGVRRLMRDEGDTKNSWDYDLAASGNSWPCGEIDKNILEEVYAVQEKFLSRGTFVTVFYDAPSDSLICIDTDSKYMVCRNDSGETIPEKSVAQIIENEFLFGNSDEDQEIEGPFYAVQKPDTDNITNIVIIPFGIEEDGYGICLPPSDREKIAIVEIEGEIPEEYDYNLSVGVKKDSWKLNTGNAGFKTTSYLGGEDLPTFGFIREIGIPFVWEATADESAGEITAKRIDSNGNLIGEEITFAVLPE